MKKKVLALVAVALFVAGILVIKPLYVQDPDPIGTNTVVTSVVNA